jgi:aldose 1-epimerase
LKIEYTATTDAKTVVNLTNHAYYNLNGAGSGTILNHKLQVFGTGYTPVDTGLIPTGKIEPVAGTPFDFTKPEVIGARIGQDNVQLKNGKGYDHNFVIGNGKPSDTLRHAATVWADQSGIVMNVYSMEPGLQFYTGNFMDGSHGMKNGKTDAYRTGFCLETQHFPDSPNEPSWPSTELDPGQTYHTVTLYTFSTSK